MGKIDHSNMGVEKEPFLDVASDVKKPSISAVSPYRWIIVSLYTLVYFGNCSTGVIVAAADLSCKFYGIKEYQITWSGNAAYFTQLFGYLIGTLIASWLGLRTTMVLSSGLNAVSACVMLASAQPDGFPFVVLGYVIQTMSNCLVASLAPEISAVWFERDCQVQATNFGLNVGYYFGYSVGFLIPAIAFKDSERNKDMKYVGKALLWVMISQVIFTLVLFAMVFMLFKDRPKFHPTIAEAKRAEIIQKSKVLHAKQLVSDIAHIVKNHNFQLAAISLALVEYTDLVIQGQLNQLLSWKYRGSEDVIGWFGFSMYWVCLAGATLLGLVVDRTKKWKLCAVIFSVLSTVFWIAFTECLRGYSYMPLTFSMFFLHSFFNTPLVPILTDAVVEMTYPIAPSHSYVYVLTLEQIYAIIMVFVSGWLFHVQHYRIYVWLMSGAFITATILISLSRVATNRLLSEGSPEPKVLSADSF